MRSRQLKYALVIASFAAAAVTGDAALAQSRVQAPNIPPPPPGVQSPNVNPTNQAIAALSLKIDALAQSAGRQVVALHFTPTETGGWAESQNTWAKNNERSEFICKQALGDRFGRVLSRSPQTNGDRWFFAHVLCETKP